MVEGSPLVGDEATVVMGDHWAPGHVEAVRGLAMRLRVKDAPADLDQIRFALNDDAIAGGQVHFQASVLHVHGDGEATVLAVEIQRAMAPTDAEALKAFLRKAFPDQTIPDAAVVSAGESAIYHAKEPAKPKLRQPTSRPLTQPRSRVPTTQSPVTRSKSPASRRFAKETEALRVAVTLTVDGEACPGRVYRASATGKLLFLVARCRQTTFGDLFEARIEVARPDEVQVSELVISALGGVEVDLPDGLNAFVARVAPRTPPEQFGPWRFAVHEGHRLFQLRPNRERLHEEQLHGGPPEDVVAELAAG